MKKLLLLLLLLGLACPYACLAKGSSLQKSAGDIGGIECSLRFNERLRSDAWEWSNTFNIGDPIWFDVILKNTSQQDVAINSFHYDEQGEFGPEFRSGIDPVLLDGDGREVAPLRQARFKTSDYMYTLAPAEEVSFSFYLGDWYGIEEAGSYSLYLRFHGLPGIGEAVSNSLAFKVISGVGFEERANFARLSLAVIAFNPADSTHLQVYLDEELVLDEKFNAIDLSRVQENQRDFFFNLEQGRHSIRAVNLNSNAVFEKEFEAKGAQEIITVLSYFDSWVGSEDTHGTLHSPDSFVFEIQDK